MWKDDDARRAYQREYYKRHDKTKRQDACRRWRWKKLKPLFEEAGWQCHYCKTVVPPERREIGLHGLSVDHKVQRSCGGDDSAENRIIACMDCNRRKFRRSYEDFIYNVLNWPRDAEMKQAFDEWDEVTRESPLES